jgi:transposase InsO family protein
MNGFTILVETSSGVFRPLVPASFRRPIFDASLAHPGIRAFRRLISSRFLWPRLASQVARWCRDCQQCQGAKVSSTPASPPQHIANPTQRFSHLHVDLVGPLPPSAGGHTHLLTVLDRYTRWAEAIPLRSTSAESCAAALIGGWVARFGVPEQITSDRSRQFCSSLWDALTHRVKMRFTTPYHPQSNRAVERFHRRLKDSLRARLAGGDWPDHLPWVLLGLRAALREDSGVSAAELVYGSQLALPGQFLSAAEPPPSSFVRQLQSAVPCVADKSGCSPPPAPPPASLRSARFVYVCSPPVSPGLAPAFRGPYRVRVPGVKFFVIDIGGKPSASAGVACRLFVPASRLGGGGTVEAPTRLRVPQKIHHYVVINLCRVLTKWREI